MPPSWHSPFNKATINRFTELIFIDEASPSTIAIDHWKILTQRGYTACDVKYKTTKSFINLCPMLLTAQQQLEFGPEDQPAMDRRLKKDAYFRANLEAYVDVLCNKLKLHHQNVINQLIVWRLKRWQFDFLYISFLLQTHPWICFCFRFVVVVVLIFLFCLFFFLIKTSSVL